MSIVLLMYKLWLPLLWNLAKCPAVPFKHKAQLNRINMNKSLSDLHIWLLCLSSYGKATTAIFGVECDGHLHAARTHVKDMDKMLWHGLQDRTISSFKIIPDYTFLCLSLRTSLFLLVYFKVPLWMFFYFIRHW